jgi:hypothetical protein
MNPAPRKTLWVNLAAGHRLRCDGPALRIDSHQQPPSWMPWHRLELLVLEGDGELPTEVLVQAARHGVRVRMVWHGSAVCDVEPTEDITDSLDAQWDALLDRPRWRHSWRAFRLRQTLWAVARTLSRPVRLDDALRWTHPQALATALKMPASELEDALARINTSIKLDVRLLLRDAGWSAVRLQRPRPGPDVSGHVRRMLAFEAVRLWRQGLPQQPVHWYAARRHLLLARGRSSLDGVLRWLADQVGEG